MNIPTPAPVQPDTSNSLESGGIETLAHRIAWRYKKSSDPAHSDTWTFNAATLAQFARALSGVQPDTELVDAETQSTIHNAVCDSQPLLKSVQTQAEPVAWERRSIHRGEWEPATQDRVDFYKAHPDTKPETEFRVIDAAMKGTS